MIQASVVLSQPAAPGRQFVVTTGSGNHLIIDDAVGATGPKPIELGRPHLPAARRSM